jgi:hypothetical protein
MAPSQAIETQVCGFHHFAPSVNACFEELLATPHSVRAMAQSTFEHSRCDYQGLNIFGLSHTVFLFAYGILFCDSRDPRNRVELPCPEIARPVGSSIHF